MFKAVILNFVEGAIILKKILVTGGTGFIGSHTVVELLNAGYEPVIIDNLHNSDKHVVDQIKKITGTKPAFYEDDYTNKNKLLRIIERDRIDGVIHFAAYKAVDESIKKPLSYYQNNVGGLLTLLDCMNSRNIKAFVFSSSCTVYGEPDKLPITEESPLKPATSPYGASKQIGEQIIQDSVRVSNHLSALSLRYFNPIGAHQSGLIGELPRGTPANLIPFVTQTAAGLRSSVTVYGNNYPTRDGTCIRDYIHVVDLAQAHIRALELAFAKSAGFYDTVNIGTGKGNSVLEIIETFEKVNKILVPHKFGPRRPGDIVSIYANVKKAESLLNWRARLTLEDALRDAWRWQQNITK